MAYTQCYCRCCMWFNWYIFLLLCVRFYNCKANVSESRFLLPFAGMLIVFSYNSLGMKDDKGTNLVISSIRSKDEVPLRMVLLIFTSTSITHLFGGSAGREGAALQIGGGIGTKIGKIFKLDERGLSILTMCGMSAVFSALFGTPLTAAIFSMEVVSVGLMYYSALVPCLFSSVIAYEMAIHAGVEFEVYKVTNLPPDTILTYGKVILVGLCCAMMGVIFCELMHKFSKYIHNIIKNRYVLVFAGGVAIIILTLLVGNQNYNGAGTAIIEEAIAGDAEWYSFILKMIFTVITLSCGFKGGRNSSNILYRSDTRVCAWPFSGTVLIFWSGTRTYRNVLRGSKLPDCKPLY